MHAGTKWPLCPLKPASLPDLTGVPPTKVFSSPSVCLFIHPTIHIHPSIYPSSICLPIYLPSHPICPSVHIPISFNKCLLNLRHCFRCWGHSNEQAKERALPSCNSREEETERTKQQAEGEKGGDAGWRRDRKERHWAM